MEIVGASSTIMSCADIAEEAIFEHGNIWLPMDEADTDVIENFGINEKLYTEEERKLINAKNCL
jgi:hypothetical protein